MWTPGKGGRGGGGGLPSASRRHQSRGVVRCRGYLCRYTSLPPSTVTLSRGHARCAPGKRSSVLDHGAVVMGNDGAGAGRRIEEKRRRFPCGGEGVKTAAGVHEAQLQEHEKLHFPVVSRLLGTRPGVCDAERGARVVPEGPTRPDREAGGTGLRSFPNMSEACRRGG